MLGERTGVLVAAAGAAWEVGALRALAAPASRAVLLKRCVDLSDLLATAATGQARVAVVAAGLPGLDADSVSHLRGAGAAVVVVADARSRAPGGDLAGVSAVVDATDVERLVTVVPAVALDEDVPGETEAVSPCPDDPGSPGHGSRAPGRLVAVWGPTGAPGRTTVAVTTATELASRGHDTLLVDADGYGGAVAQHLGVLDEVSGLLGAVRLANGGRLDAPGLAATAREVRHHLRVLTGLPRADRWVEVRPAAFDLLLATARSLCGYTVLDLGFGLEQDPQSYGSSVPQRNHMTVGALDVADEVVVVGSADPVGLARLARGLVELRGTVPTATTRVVVNRVRPSLGWTEQEVRAMVEGFVTPASMHFLPDEPAVVDRALMGGRPVQDSGDSGLARAVAGLADAVAGHPPRSSGRRARLRRRRAGTAR